MNRTICRLAAGAAAATTAAVLSLGLGASAATAAPAASPATQTCSFGQHVAYIAKQIPTELRVAAKDVRDLAPGSERRAAAKALRAQVVAGDFGEAAQKRAIALEKLTPRQLRDLPANLKDDLRDLRGAPRGEKIALLEEISNAALDGEYGAAAQSRVETLRDSDAWQNCTPPASARRS